MNDWRELKIMVKSLAGVARLTIVYHLAHRDEITVTELTDILGLSQPLVSWHLRKLRRAGLIRTHRHGRQVHCSLDKARLTPLSSSNCYPSVKNSSRQKLWQKINVNSNSILTELKNLLSLTFNLPVVM